MIEIKNAPQSMASNSAKMLKIEGIVKAWRKIESDDLYTEAQRDLVSRTSMNRISQILGEQNAETDAYSVL